MYALRNLLVSYDSRNLFCQLKTFHMILAIKSKLTLCHFSYIISHLSVMWRAPSNKMTNIINGTYYWNIYLSSVKNIFYHRLCSLQNDGIRFIHLFTMTIECHSTLFMSNICNCTLMLKYVGLQIACIVTCHVQPHCLHFLSVKTINPKLKIVRATINSDINLFFYHKKKYFFYNFGDHEHPKYVLNSKQFY